MTSATAQLPAPPAPPAGPPAAADWPSTWPVEVRAVLDLLGRSPHFGDERRDRSASRRRYCVEASVSFLDAEGGVRTMPAYTSNLSPGHVGFVCAGIVRAGDRVIMSFPAPGGKTRTVKGEVRRCRQFFDGWFDCAVRFDRVPAPQRRWTWWGREQGQS